MSCVSAAGLKLEELSKWYPNRVKAVSELSLEVAPGQVFGLVGPNGAGKSTLLKLAAGLLVPQQGRVICGGEDVTGLPQKAAAWIGLMPDPLGVYTDVSVSEYLEFYARAYEIAGQERRIAEVVELLDLGQWLEDEVETLSAGWQRRTALGRVLLADPPILLLDEPAAGLDITARNELLHIVRRMADEKKTVIISSHILPELEQLADRFGIMNHGRWMEVAGGKCFFNREDLQQGLEGKCWSLRCNLPDDALKQLSAVPVVEVHRAGDLLILRAKTDSDGAAALRCVVDTGIEVHEFARVQTDLNSWVLKILGKEEKA